MAPLPGQSIQHRPPVFDSDEFANERTGEYVKRWLRVPCPECGREASPLCSPNTTVKWSGWVWVGLSHQEPRTDYEARCAGCGATYEFGVQVPQ